MVLDAEGQLVEEERVATRDQALRKRFSGCQRMRIALETGTHSPWVSRVLKECGHELIVANSRKLRLIYENRRKNDRVDAMYLARLARLDPQLLSPVEHRGPQAQKDLALLRSRDVLVEARTQLINHSRGLVKSVGQRLPRCSSEAFARKVLGAIPESLQPGLLPVLEMITSLTAQIKALDRRMDALADQVYPETKLLRQVTGVGPITSLAYGGCRAIRKEPCGRVLSWTDSRKLQVRRLGSPDADYQGRGCVTEAVAGRCSSVHPRSVRAGHGSASFRVEDRPARRQERQEESRRRRGAQTGGPSAPPLALRGSLRAPLSGDSESRPSREDRVTTKTPQRLLRKETGPSP